MKNSEYVRYCTRGGKRGRRKIAWVEKHKHREKIRRRFLSRNPALDMEKLEGIRCCQAVYINLGPHGGRPLWDPKTEYSFNPIENVYLSERGDLRVWHGRSVHSCSGSFALGETNSEYAKVTNRRLRRLRITEEDAAERMSYYRKSCGPRKNNIW